MKAFQAIADVFSILHDGTVEGWSGNHNQLDLQISCLYLAERIDSSFEHFHLQLFDIEQIAFNAWMEDAQRSTKILTQLANIFEPELEILSAKVQAETVVITFNQADSAFDYCGGDLHLRCKEVRVFNQAHQEISPAQLKTIAEGYWADWEKKNKASQ
jgi:hypothetical protein